MIDYCTPWKISAGVLVYNSENIQIMSSKYSFDTREMDIANVARAVECVNAMEGIEDPKKLRQTWDAIQHLELDAYLKTKQLLDSRTKRLNDALDEIGYLNNQVQFRQDDRSLKLESWKVTSGDVTDVVLAGSHLEAIVVFERKHGLYETTSVQLLAK